MSWIDKRTITWETKSGKQRKATRYEAGYRDRAGVRHRQLFELKREAQKWLDEQTTGIVTGQWVDPMAGRELFKAYAERWRERQVWSENTEDQFGSVLTHHIYPKLGGMRMDAVTGADIQSLVKQWSRTAAATTTVQRYNMLAMLLRGAVKDRVIPISPAVDIKLPRVQAKAALVPITTDVVLRLREQMPERLRAFVTIAACTGMRRGELLGLTIDRVAEDFGAIRVDRQLSRKSTGKRPIFAPPKTTASVRTIPVAQIVLDTIEQHVDTYGVHDETGLLFTTEIGTPLSTSTLQAAWSKAAKAIHTDSTPHDLRHYYASIQISGGCSIKQLQANLGHKSASETWDTYGHLMGDEDDRSRAVIEAALGGKIRNSVHSMSTVTGI